MSPSFLVPLTSASSSWTSSRKRWLPFTSNSRCASSPPSLLWTQFLLLSWSPRPKPPPALWTPCQQLWRSLPCLQVWTQTTYTTTNHPFLSKILERAVAAQLHQHMASHELYEPLQAGFRARHSTETALIKINDLLISANFDHISFLILLDHSAAFDTISHTILLIHPSYLTTLASLVQHSPGSSPI